MQMFDGAVMEEFELSLEAMESLMVQFDSTKSTAPNGVHPRILKVVAPVIAQAISALF